MWYHADKLTSRKLKRNVLGLDRVEEGGCSATWFLSELKRRYGSVLRAFLAVDASTGSLNFQTFSVAYARLGYSRDVRMVWFLLDADGSGEVDLDEMDPAASDLLRKFHSAVVKAGDGSFETGWHRAIDTHRSLRLSRPVFCRAALALGFSSSDCELLFSIFNAKDKLTITVGDAMFVDTWMRRVKRCQAPSTWINKRVEGVIDIEALGIEADWLKDDNRSSSASTQEVTSSSDHSAEEAPGVRAAFRMDAPDPPGPGFVPALARAVPRLVSNGGVRANPWVEPRKRRYVRPAASKPAERPRSAPVGGRTGYMKTPPPSTGIVRPPSASSSATLAATKLIVRSGAQRKSSSS
mmetsp:Transcript_13325/g.33332  ORF Transcript_13325/g.33332 Transcript_13325/m.33332 type:complete len:352 (+) Transcript_13325:24-1079(+)